LRKEPEAIQLEELKQTDESVASLDMRIEVVIIPVSDVDRAKRFYGSLGWRLDADFRSSQIS